ncbi:ATP synthase F1 subunit epsilon [Endomicrobium proavitum]|uniref:ATP synthase epsilon chain n=1 Tax=Endomicrobium proavitum TaxID=1408281 RepID=A0A0G3WGZ3_9BACT|nr:ATP synthase F1 subunit epsilon [Endomicrobium proavitum]AKL97941.1 ATP synthase epsilon chain [Endomicrobium proavitum]
MNTFELEILSPEGSSFKGNVLSASFPTASGVITVLPGHANLVTKLVEGQILLQTELSGAKIIIVTGGFIEIFNGKTNIVAEFAIQDDANREKIEKAMKLAKEIKEKKKNSVDMSVVESQLKKSVFELKSGINLKRKN